MVRVLIVDDERDILITEKNIINREGFEVIVEQDARRAIDLAKREKFDLVILDIMMPHFSGEEVAKQIRAESKNDFKIIFCSIVPKSEINPFDVDGYIQKPFDYKQYVDEVKRVLVL